MLVGKADHLRQNSIVIDMVPVAAWRVGDDQSLQPLDTPSTNLARNNCPQRTTVVWKKGLSVHLVGKHDSSIDIHGPVELNRRAIVTIWL